MTGNYIILLIIILFSAVTESDQTFIPEQQDDCLSCHGDLIRNNVVHPELATTCDICHISTGEKHPGDSIAGFSLSEKLPTLCYNCHYDFQEKTEMSSFVHKPVIDTVTCINCHNPHSSPEQRMVIKGVRDLCFDCHNKTIINDTTVIANISQAVLKGESVHEPVESGECLICHNPHFSDRKSLLTGDFPAVQYLKAEVSSFDLCFMCHDTNLLEAAQTEIYTSFRNGDINMHYIHTNGNRGRNCTMCHDVHGASNMKLIRDKLKFGSWEIKIKFTLNENGGSCLTACHSEKTYNREINLK